VNQNILIIKGRSDLILRNQVIKTFLTAIIIFSGIIGGITVMLLVRIFTTLIAAYLNGQYSGRLLGFSVGGQISAVSAYFWSEIMILLVILAIGFLPVNIYFILSLQITIGLLLFVLVFEIRKHTEYLEIKNMLFRIFQKASAL